MLDLLIVDPATLQASPELDALIAEWMGWERIGKWWWYAGKAVAHVHYWRPSLNPAQAGEARRKARVHRLNSNGVSFHCELAVEPSRFREFYGVAFCNETNDDKGRAEALATGRAIAAALKATGKVGGPARS